MLHCRTSAVGVTLVVALLVLVASVWEVMALTAAGTSALSARMSCPCGKELVLPRHVVGTHANPLNTIASKDLEHVEHRILLGQVYAHAMHR